MRTCIFIVGDRNSGKTTLIRSLTGCPTEGLWTVRNLRNRSIQAFVVSSALTERGSNPPDDFPDSLEREFRIKRNQYQILICPDELRTRSRRLERYIQNARTQRFNVKVAIIKRNFSGHRYNPQDLVNTQSICRRLGIRPLLIDITKDYVEEARRIRRRVYP